MTRSSDMANGGLFSGFDGLRWDLWLASTAIGLVLFGLVMVYSASGFEEGSHRLLLGQFQWAMLGFGVMAVLTRVDYHNFARPVVVYGLLAVCIVLLIAVLFFPARNGAHRWIRIQGWSAQPSELAKLALIFFLARFLSQREEARELRSFGMTMLPACVVSGLLAALIMKEPDLGTTAMLGVVFLTLMFVAGVPSRHLLKLAPLAIIVVYWSVFRVGWRLDRVL